MVASRSLGQARKSKGFKMIEGAKFRNVARLASRTRLRPLGRRWDIALTRGRLERLADGVSNTTKLAAAMDSNAVQYNASARMRSYI